MIRRLLLAAAVCASASCAPPTVLRSAGGEVVRGRFIAPQAYEVYARGALAESEGQLDLAAAAFLRATEIDPDGPEPWTRLAAVLCRQQRFSEANEALDAAERALPGYAPLYRERARCLLSRGDATEALAQADRALVFDPADEDTALLRADILEKTGDGARAVRELYGRLVAGPLRARIAKRLEPLARAQGDEVAASFAHRILETQAASNPPSPSRPDIDRALERGDLAAARRFGTNAGFGPGAVALRAAALGLRTLAAEQARLVLGADPSNSDALVALFAATAPSPAFPVERPATPASRLGRLVLAETLLRYAGSETMALAVTPEDLAAQTKDPLEDAVAARLRAARP